MIVKLFIFFTLFISNCFAQDVDVLYADNKKQVRLIQLEKQWLSKKEPVKYVYDPDWKPFEWRNDLDEHTGIIFDILQLIEEKSHIDFIPVNTKNWSESVKKVQSSEVPMFSVVGVTKDREKYLTFIDKPLFSTPYVLVCRLGEDYLDGFKDTKDKKIITIASSTIENKLSKDKRDIKFSLVSSAKDGFEALENKKSDIFVINAATAKYYINILGYSDLKIAYKTKLSLDLRIAVRKDAPKEIVSIINKSIELISKKEINDIFYKWTEVTVKKEIDWDFIFYILVFTIVVVSFLIYNNKKLENMVSKQTYKLESAISLFNKYVISIKVDLDNNIIYVNDAFCEISGYSKNELIGLPFKDILYSNNFNKIAKDIEKVMLLDDVFTDEIQYLKQNGDYFWAKSVVAPQFNNTKLELYSFVMQDITDKKLVEELAITDALTNIYNRRYFNTLSKKLLAQLKNDNKNMTLLMLDIDNFKRYNDAYGHQKGDEALIGFTTALSKSLQNIDGYCFRLGGEEFGIILTNSCENDVVDFVELVRSNIKSLEIIHEYNVSRFISSSIGVVHKNTNDIKDVDTMFKEADDLLYEAKHNGRNMACYNFK